MGIGFFPTFGTLDFFLSLAFQLFWTRFSPTLSTCLSSFKSFSNCSLQDIVTIDINPETVSRNTGSNADTVPSPAGPNG